MYIYIFLLFVYIYIHTKSRKSRTLDSHLKEIQYTFETDKETVYLIPVYKNQEQVDPQNFGSHIYARPLSYRIIKL